MSTLPTLDPSVKKPPQFIINNETETNHNINQAPALPAINFGPNHSTPTFQPKAITPRGFLQKPIMPPAQKKLLMAPRSARQYVSRVPGSIQPSNPNIEIQQPSNPQKPPIIPLSHRQQPGIQCGISKMPKKRLTNIILPPLESNGTNTPSNINDAAHPSDDEIYTGDGNISDEYEEDMFDKEELNMQVGQPMISRPT